MTGGGTFLVAGIECVKLVKLEGTGDLLKVQGVSACVLCLANEMGGSKKGVQDEPRKVGRP